MAKSALTPERDLLAFLNSLQDESDTRRDETAVKDAEINLRFQRGNQWPDSTAVGRRTDSNQFRFLMNVLNTMLQRKVALITDSRPEMDVVSRGSMRWKGTATGLKKICLYLWDEDRVEQNLARELMRAGTIGCTIAVPVWDPMANYGRGEIDIKWYDPRQVSLDPSITRSSDIRKAEYFQTRDVMPLNAVRESYGDRARDVKADAKWSEYDAPRAARTRYTSILTAMARPWKRDNLATMESASPRVELRHSWFRDFQRDDKMKPRFGLPRVLRHVVDAGGEILTDEPSRYVHGQIPGHFLDWGVEIENPWGMSEVGGLRRIQYTLNRIVGQIMDNVLITNRTRVTADTDAVDSKTWDTITQNPNGLYVRKRTGRQFQYDMPQGAIPPFVLDLVNLLIQAVDMVSGLYDAAQGKRPQGLTSGVAIEGLQMASQSIVRLQARAFEDLLERVFQQVVALIWQYYTTDRIFAILGPGQVYEQYDFIRSKFIQDDTGDSLPEDAWQDFVFRIRPGSSLASTRMQRAIMALNLNKAGLLPGVDVLRAAEWPDAEETAAQAQKEMELKAQAGMMEGDNGNRRHRATQDMPLPGANARGAIA